MNIDDEIKQFIIDKGLTDKYFVNRLLEPCEFLLTHYLEIANRAFSQLEQPIIVSTEDELCTNNTRDRFEEIREQAAQIRKLSTTLESATLNIITVKNMQSIKNQKHKIPQPNTEENT